jgi:hypothetical protein
VSLAPNPVDALVDERYLAASAAAVDSVRGHAAQVLHRLKLWDRVPRPQPLAAVAAALGTPAELSFALAWLLEEAAALGAVRIERSGWEDLYEPAAFPPAELFAAHRRRLDELAGGVGSSRAMFDHVAEHYPAYLRGEKSGAGLLLKGPAQKLLEEYFGAANPLYDVHNQLGWVGLREALRRLGRPARALELGTGTGGGTEAILRGLRRDGGALASLTLSDVSPTFLVNTLERLAGRADPPPVPLERRRLDFTRPLTEQGVAPGGIDVLVGVNALHNGNDLAGVVGATRSALAADGYLIVSESLCQPSGHVHQDFIFNLLPLERRVQAGVSSRFLSAEAWEEVLRAGGFSAELYRNRRGPQLALLAIARPG